MAKRNPPESTKFKPGQSGNPKGRPRKIPALDSLLADVLGEETDGMTTAKKILVALSKQAIKGNVRAAEVLLDRAFGKAQQNVDLSGTVSVGPLFDFTALSADDLHKVNQIVTKYQK